MKPTLLTATGNPENQDRADIIDDGDRIVLCVADGAGGLSGGAEAAGMAVEFVRTHAAELNDGDSCVTVLRQMDEAIVQDLVAGETTCAVAIVSTGQVLGASVGDSSVWLINDSGFVDLSRGQQRKPFIGSGGAWPMPFIHRLDAGQILLLATDGLVKYTSSERIIAACRDHPSETATQRLIELVRYPSGALPDDVTVIVTRL